MTSTETGIPVDRTTVHGVSEGVRPGLAVVRRLVDRLMGTDLDPEQSRSLSQIEETILGLQGFIQDLVDLADLESGSPTLVEQPFDLPSLVREVVRTVRPAVEKRGLDLSLVGVRHLPGQVRGDVGRLRQILGHLLSNAIDATISGVVNLTVALLEETDDGTTVRFEVGGTGAGIDPDDFDRLFRPVETVGFRATRGAGLGLAVPRRLVQAMGGELTVEPRNGSGSAFCFELRFAKVVERVDPPDTSADPAWVVVISETDDPIPPVIAALREEGHTIAVYPSSEMALASIRPDDPARPDVVMLAHGQAFEIAERIIPDPRLGRSPLLLVSADGHRGEGEKCLRMGIQGYLTEPVSPIDAIEAVALLRTGVAQALVTRHLLRERRTAMNILLVENHPTRRARILRTLEPLGHEVTVCSMVSDALVEVTKGGWEVVAVSSDLNDSDALAFARAVRRWETGAGSRVRMVAGVPMNSEDDQRRYRAAGFDAIGPRSQSPVDLYRMMTGGMT